MTGFTSADFREIFRGPPTPGPIWNCHMAVLEWYLACQYTLTPEFAAELEQAIRNQPRLTLEQKRTRWEQWQAEQGK